MPKVGRVMGINNAINIPDAQRLFNKLKGRLSELQKSVSILDAKIEEKEKENAKIEDDHKRKEEELVEEKEEGSETGDGGSYNTDPDDDWDAPPPLDGASGSSSVVSRKYGEFVTGYRYTLADFIYENYVVDSYLYQETKIQVYYVCFINGVRYTVGSRYYDSIRISTGKHTGYRASIYPNGDDRHELQSWQNESSIPSPIENWVMYEELGVNWDTVATGLVQITLDNENPSAPYSEQELEALNEINDTELSSNTPDAEYREPEEGEGYVVYTSLWDEGPSVYKATSGYPTEIKIRSTASIGADAEAVTVVSSFTRGDNGNIVTHDEDFTRGGKSTKTSDWIDAGSWPTKGHPSNSELGTEIIVL